MFRFITTLVLVLAAYAVVTLFDLGYSYAFTTGEGLHPAIAALFIVIQLACAAGALWLLRQVDLGAGTGGITDDDGLDYVSHEAITGLQPLQSK